MMENRNGVLMVFILCVVIAGQGISYIALDSILKTVLQDRPTQIIVTVSGNDAQAVEIPSETGKLDAVKDKPYEVPFGDVVVEYGAIKDDFAVSGVLTPAGGVNYFQGHKETYYNLPMDGVIYLAQARGISGEYFVREDGVKMYRTADGEFVICAARQDLFSQIIPTSLGDGIVLDTGSFALYNPDQVDIAVTW